MLNNYSNTVYINCIIFFCEVILLRQVDVFPYYKLCVKEMEKQYNYMKSLFNSTYTDELCKMRGYVGEEQRSHIAKMHLGYCNIVDVDELGSMRSELGLVSSKDNFLLADRFIIPVEDINGNLVALIGYYQDFKKYITTSSPFFSKNLMFYNFRQAYKLSMRDFGGLVFLVEGIFDCISMSSLGLPCIATMGATVTNEKCELLKFFKKVIAIPDNDTVGRRALNRYDKRYGWKVPYNATMIKFDGGYLNVGGNCLKVKDMDNFISWFDADDVRDILLSFKDSKEDIEILKL